MQMKRLTTTIILVLLLAVQLPAQEKQQPKFSPEQFQAELEQYITKEAGLTQKEAASFFPVYREMQNKQRAIFGRQRKRGFVKPSDEQGCQQAIRQFDNDELEQKRIQQTYHNKMLRIISGSKLFDVIMAEDRFHRMKFRNWGNSRNPSANNWGNRHKPAGNNWGNRPKQASNRQ